MISKNNTSQDDQRAAFYFIRAKCLESVVIGARQGSIYWGSCLVYLRIYGGMLYWLLAWSYLYLYGQVGSHCPVRFTEECYIGYWHGHTCRVKLDCTVQLDLRRNEVLAIGMVILVW